MEATAPSAEDLYRAAVGEDKADYYVPKFLAFDEGASKASWNWPAFFVSFMWMMYRRMHGPAFLYLFALPFVLAILGTLLVVLAGAKVGTALYLLVAIAACWVAVPMFANVLYYRSVKERVASAVRTSRSPEAALERLGRESSVTNPVVILLIAFGLLIPVTGLLAAIAIPAYQDYTIRTQVTEGLNLASAVKAAVAESHAGSQAWPADAAAAGLDSTGMSGKYVEAIEVSNGTIFILYGNAAHSRVAGGTLSLRPSLAGEEIVWSCGYAGGDDGDADPHATDIEPKYLPSLCRG